MKRMIKNLILFLTLVLTMQGAFCYCLTYDNLNSLIKSKALAETKSQTDAKKVKSKHKRRALTSSESENNFIETETRQIESDDELQK